MATKKRASGVLSAFRTLQKRKKSFCAGRSTKASVQKAASAYIKKAFAKGQTKAEATKKANRVKNSGCKMTSRIAGTRKRKTTRRKKK